MIAGEYAVLEPNQPLIVTAVDRFIYASIEPSDTNLLTLENFQLKNLQWKYIDRQVIVQKESEDTSFVQQAMAVTLSYLQENGVIIEPFTLTIKSELDDYQSGLKYGLGSSAAVVVSVVTAISTQLLRQPIDELILFKLAAIAHVKTQGSGSGADIAASIYGGILRYSSFQAAWLLEEFEQTRSVTKLVEAEWPYLSIHPLNFPSTWEMAVGWTGKPASTANLVDRIHDVKVSQPARYEQFITDSKQAVEAILEGIHTRQIDLFFAGLKQNRDCLIRLGDQADVEIETKLLKELTDMTVEHGGGGKLSGAGGGDCGIAFNASGEKIARMKNDWEVAGIKPLEITTYPHGAEKTHTIC